MSLSKILGEIQKELTKKDEIRQEIQAAARKATKLSKQAIFSVHKINYKEAFKKIEEAEKTISDLSKLSIQYLDLFYSGLVDSAFQEYTEARVLFFLIKESRFVGFKEISVPASSYVLGLADVIGELRRNILDLLRKGKTEKAEQSLELMEIIYTELTNLDVIQVLIPGLRRKCDVARRVIESTRGDVTIEVRKSQLENSIKKLQKTLEAR